MQCYLQSLEFEKVLLSGSLFITIYMKNKEEYILCAAIWYKDIPLLKPECLNQRGQNPYNVDRGAVFCGWRHFNCIMIKSAVTGLRDAECGEFVQGFLTNKNRFVTREVGAKIAYDAKQLKEGVRVEKLYSEDLY